MTATATPALRTSRARTAALRATLRLGRRTVRAGGWRNVLVVALIALVVAIAPLVAIAGRSTQVEDRAWITDQFGAVADVQITAYTPPWAFDDLPADLQQAYLAEVGEPPLTLAELPDVPTLVADTLGDVPLLGMHQIHSGAFNGGVQLTAVDLTGPLADGLYLRTGPVPGEGEALLSAALMDDLDVGVGDAVDLPGAGTVTVVGRVAQPSRYAIPQAVLPAGALGEDNTWLVQADDPRPLQVAIDESRLRNQDVGLSMSTRPGPEDFGFTDQTLARRVVSDPATVGAMIGALLGLQVGLVAAAAFATGTRRRLREYGLLGAVGADPGQVRRTVLAEAGVLGVLGALLGAVLGLGLIGPLTPLVEDLTYREVLSLQIRPLDVLAPAAVGVVAAVGAALWPSRTLARTPAANALAGRIPLGQVPRWAPAGALVTVTVGVGLLALAVNADGAGLWREAATVLGVLMTGLGAAALGVPLIGLLGGLAHRLPLMGRLVARDAARQRTRSAATVAALVAVVMVPTVVLTAEATDRARFGSEVQGPPTVWVSSPYLNGVELPVTPGVLAEVTEALPVEPEDRLDLHELQVGAQVLTDVGGPSAHHPGGGPAYVATDEVVALLGLDAAAVAFLDGGGVVDLARPGTLSEAQRESTSRPAVLVEWNEESREVEVALRSVEVAPGPLGGGLLVPPSVAAGLDAAPRMTVLLTLPRPLTSAEAETAYREVRFANVSLPVDPDDLSVPAIALAAALGLALVVVAMTTALAATESDRDLQTMSAVGADPSLRRRFHALQSLLHTLMAAALGIPAALLLILVAWEQVGGGLVIPWGSLALLGLGVPVLVAGVLWLVMRPARPATARRIA